MPKLGPAILLEEQSWWERGHEELNAILRKAGWGSGRIEAAHRVAAGLAPLSEACPECEEQELYYSQNVRMEGRRAIVCLNCNCTCVDKNEQGGLAEQAAAIMQVARKQGKLTGIMGHG